MFDARPSLEQLFPDRIRQSHMLAAALHAFRAAFLAQIDAMFAGATRHRDAWQAVLDRGLGALTKGITPAG